MTFAKIFLSWTSALSPLFKNKHLSSNTFPTFSPVFTLHAASIFHGARPRRFLRHLFHEEALIPLFSCGFYPLFTASTVLGIAECLYILFPRGIPCWHSCRTVQALVVLVLTSEQVYINSAYTRIHDLGRVLWQGCLCRAL